MSIPVETPPPVNRTLVAVIAVVCLAIAAIVFAVDSERWAVIGAFLRVGLVMGALWFAIPATGGRLGWRIAAPIIVAVAIVAGAVRNARMLVVVVPLLLVIAALMLIFRPKPPSHSGPRRRR